MYKNNLIHSLYQPGSVLALGLMALNIPAVAQTVPAGEAMPVNESAASYFQTANAHEENRLVNWLEEGHVYGHVRAATYLEQNSGPFVNDRAHAVGATLNYLSPHQNGFRFGLGVFTSQTLGLNPGKNRTYADHHVSPKDVTILGNAYLEYDTDDLSVKAGRISINTPLAKHLEDRGTIPLAFEGVAGTYKLPIDADVRVYGYRIWRFKKWDTNAFSRYDTGFPEDPLSTLPRTRTSGFTAAGTKYKNEAGIDAQLWWYDFKKRLQVSGGILRVPLTALNFNDVKPYTRFAYAREWNTGDRTFPYSERPIRSTLYDFKLGFDSPRVSGAVFTTYIPNHNGAFQNGAFISPYQFSGYDEIEFESTENVNYALNAFAQPGHGFGGQLIYHTPKWQFMLLYTRLSLDEAEGPVLAPPAVLRPAVSHGYTISGFFNYNFTERLSASIFVGHQRQPYNVIGYDQFQWLRLTYHFGTKPHDMLDY